METTEFEGSPLFIALSIFTAIKKAESDYAKNPSPSFVKNGTRFKVNKNGGLAYTYLNGKLFASSDLKNISGARAYIVDRLDNEKIIFHHSTDAFDNYRCIFFSCCDEIVTLRELTLFDYCVAYLGMDSYAIREKVSERDFPLSQVDMKDLAKLAKIAEMSVPEMADEIHAILNK